MENQQQQLVDNKPSDDNNELNNSKEIIYYLVQHFPKCFTLQGSAFPLKVGIFHDLVARLADDPKISKTKLRLALRSYTMSWRYLYSIKEGVHRLDIDGNPCEVISSEHAKHAQEQLRADKERVNAKRIAEGKSDIPTANKNRGRPAFVNKGDKSSTRTKPAISRKVDEKKTASKAVVKNDHVKAKHYSPVDIMSLKTGSEVHVLIGQKPIAATILSIEKAHIKVKIPSGMELTITPEHVVLAN